MKTAKLVQIDRSQAVRLSKEFRFEGKKVRIRRFGIGVLLEHPNIDIDAWFAALDRYDAPLMPEGRNQPPPQERDELL